MSDRPPSDSEDRLLDIDPSAHPPSDERVASRLRDVIRKIVRPRLPEGDPRGPRKKIRGRGPVHRGLLAGAGRRRAQRGSAPVIGGALVVIVVAAIAMITLAG